MASVFSLAYISLSYCISLWILCSLGNFLNNISLFSDVTVDVNVLTPSQCTEMNEQSIKFGMVDEDFIT